MPRPEVTGRKTRTHHLDKRADVIAAQAGDDDDLLTTPQMARWLNVSVQWLEIGRNTGYGPPYKRLAPKTVRYSIGDARKWLRARTHRHTAEYRDSA